MTDEQLREMAEAAQQLEELTRHPGWAVFSDLATVELDKHRRAILGGKLEPDLYRREAGIVAGGEMVAAIPARMNELYLAALERKREEEAADAEDERSFADDPVGISG